MRLMTAVGVHEAKTHLSRLLRRVSAGEEIEIHVGGTPVARLVPIRSGARRVLGTDSGAFVVPDDFDAPLPDGVAELFS
jgi:prevent-host-death family protein